MRVLRLSVFVLCCVSAFCALADRTPSLDLDRVVAIVEDHAITQAELNTAVKRLTLRLGQQEQLPPRAVLEEDVLKRLIIRKLALRHAEEVGVQIEESVLEETLQGMAKDNHFTLQQFRQVVEQEGTEFQTFREEIREELILNRLKQREIGQKIRVTEDEINHYLKSHPMQEQQEASFYLQHVLFVADENTELRAQQQANATRFIAAAQKQPQFLELSASFGKSDQVVTHDLGWRKQAELPTLLAQEVNGMKIGDIKGPIASAGGYHVFKLIEKRAPEFRHEVKQTHVRHILLKPDLVLSNEDAQQKIKKFSKEIALGASFETLAKSHSKDFATASLGGDLGWINDEGDFPEEFENAVKKLSDNQLSEPVHTAQGWHLIQVLGRRTLDDTEHYKRQQARLVLYRQKFEQEYVAWQHQLRTDAYVQVML